MPAEKPLSLAVQVYRRFFQSLLDFHPSITNIPIYPHQNNRSGNFQPNLCNHIYR